MELYSLSHSLAPHLSLPPEEREERRTSPTTTSHLTLATREEGRDLVRLISLPVPHEGEGEAGKCEETEAGSLSELGQVWASPANTLTLSTTQ